MHGGCVRFQGGEAQELPLPRVPLYIVNTGAPVSTTGEAVASVARRMGAKHPVWELFGGVAGQMQTALEQDDLRAFQRAMRENHRLLQRIGVVPGRVGDFVAEVEAAGAAGTVATRAALAGARGEAPEPGGLLECGVRVIRKAQGGVGSGADVAASTYGGCLRFFAEPLDCVKLPVAPPLTVLYSGSKTPTPEVIAQVAESRAKLPEIHDALDRLIGQTVQQAFGAATAGDWETLGRLMNVNQGLMDALGVSDARLANLVFELRDDPEIYGSKISGSGLGDCVVGLGKAMRQEWGVPALAVAVDPAGVTVEPEALA